MNYRRALLEAIEYAPLQLMSARAARVYEDGVDQNHNRHHAVAVPTEKDFAGLLAAAAELAGIEHDLPNTLRHEGDHAEAWRSMGARACWYQVTMSGVSYTKAQFRAGLYAIGFQASSLATDMLVPKLALASMYVRPYDPSESDRMAATSLGYRDIQDIGNRILRFNFNKVYPHYQLLMPLAYEW